MNRPREIEHLLTDAAREGLAASAAAGLPPSVPGPIAGDLAAADDPASGADGGNARWNARTKARGFFRTSVLPKSNTYRTLNRPSGSPAAAGVGYRAESIGGGATAYGTTHTGVSVTLRRDSAV